jgi:hypothetical protein
MGHRTGPDTVAKRMILYPCRGSNPNLELVASRYTNWTIIMRDVAYLKALAGVNVEIRENSSQDKRLTDGIWSKCIRNSSINSATALLTRSVFN